MSRFATPVKSTALIDGYSPSSVRRSDLLLLALISVLSITGLVSYEQLTTIYYRSNLLPASLVIDFFIVAYICLTPAARFSRHLFLIFFVSCLYLFFSWMYLLLPRSVSPSATDVILVYKPFIYLALLSLVRQGRLGISLDAVELVFKILVFVFLAKYIVAKFLFGIPRPGVFTENNFELVLLLVLFIYLSHKNRIASKFWLVLLALVVMISGSRSGFLALLVGLLWSSKKMSRGIVFAVIAVPVLIALSFFYFESRLTDLSNSDQLDRFLFLLYFLDEIRSFDFWNYFLGWAPMTPLSAGTCDGLKFYSSLLSSDGNSCYSVILHVFYFRTILDHGVLGLLFLILGFYVLFRAKSLGRSLSLGILAQGLINGLSVSGLANTYFAFAVMLILASNFSEATFKRQ